MYNETIKDITYILKNKLNKTKSIMLYKDDINLLKIVFEIAKDNIKNDNLKSNILKLESKIKEI